MTEAERHLQTLLRSPGALTVMEPGDVRRYPERYHWPLQTSCIVVQNSIDNLIRTFRIFKIEYDADVLMASVTSWEAVCAVFKLHKVSSYETVQR